ncbi:serine/threonine protein kinase [Trichocoleus sp. FACHB-591]|uniref:serine/threonine protein kinase n=1 Tax=Trichocoleus sp. FACHB-591 TaxID=2692872 RepID=UPI00168307B9|nr:serine/threonine-protein kinase [Trichocoleus sp. FACHB-591]MBD2094318.1 serine/threonine protein kinase [Trichocoleus sp. FACHB-591]
MLEPGQVICDRYQLQAQFNDHPVRQTWLAGDLAEPEDENNLVVIKLLAVEGSARWEHVKLFEREAQVLEQLDHSRIPQYYDYFCLEEKPLWFALVEEYIPGASLKELLVQGEKFTELEIRDIATAILETLIYLHELSPPVLHRDIKPSNIIWGDDGKIYLVDFGAVQDRAATEGATFTVVGTYGYTPLEQFGGRAVPASDLYALGATLIHLVTGVAPADLPQKDLRLEWRDRVSLNPHLLDWIDRLTEPASDNRFSTAREALAALESGLQGAKERSRQHPTAPLAKAPEGTQVKLRQAETEMQIEIPARGTGLTLPFLSLALFFFVCSFLIALSRGYWDWAFGYLILSLTVSFLTYTSACPTRVYFDKHCFVIYRKILGYIPEKPDGGIGEIEDVFEDSTESKISSGAEVRRRITIQAGMREYSFGEGLSRAECLWLVQEIKGWLNLP